MDSTSGDWGSYGDLDVDANPHHHSAYKKSASYHFYSGAFGANVMVGCKFILGLIEGDFAACPRFMAGFGHSYVDLPTYKKKNLKSFGFEVYGKIIEDSIITIYGSEDYYIRRITN